MIHINHKITRFARSLANFFRPELARASIEKGKYQNLTHNLSGHLRETGLIQSTHKAGKRGGMMIELTEFGKCLLEEIQRDRLMNYF
jgi:hypothetical protein